MLLRTLIFGLLLNLTGLYLCAVPQTDRIEFYYGIAEGNYLIGDLQGAERGIEQMLRLNPDHLPALTLQARVMLDQGKAEQALAAAERAIALAPNNHEHKLLKALILGNMQRRDAASALIQEVIAQAPTTSDDARAANQLLGLLRMAAGEWDQAAEAFNNIYLADPASAGSSLRLSSEAYLEKARASMAAGEHDAAVAAIDQAIGVYQHQTGQEALEQRTTLRLIRARLLSQLGRFEAAIKDLQVLTGQQPENYEALITLASLYASVERWDSLEAIIRPIAQQPQLKDVALYLEGRAALAKNRVGTARAKFEAAIDALPKEADLLRRSLYFYRGICLQKLDRPAEAETALLAAIDAGFRPETSEEALIASRTLLRAQRPGDAIPILEAITLNRIAPDAAVWAMLGRAHLAADTPALALSAFNESLLIDPEQVDTRALRGSLLRKIGDLAGALSDYQVARRLAPENASIAYASGLVHLQLGEIPQAEQVIAGAAQQLPDNAGIQLLHALLAHTTSQPDAAIASLRRYQTKVTENPNPTALYLDFLLDSQDLKKLNDDEVSRYFKGEYTRKQALDASGKAETPEQARRQICSTAFWLAQFEHAQGKDTSSQELLKIALEAGNSDLTEFQLAKWQLGKD
ncbi:tetratricopeptide repeat protein [Coraliomargarita algicola]|uniref:Tetratricopeptide repeat protein n=1 Tax=Coraliomargarita algicola TaxID=3092156 RepID=A0ABZ0RQ24_9BACT|nr:tetratricopeptide repeat protein [Coraliomargarita sp. J2-16]WPJ97503.1 tetratricopeptide repeat protein [Coraliomargarita sp. J2-16]